MKDLPQPIQSFILHWGEMGTKWGINRTVAQIHALLWVTERPLNAEEICDALGVARSNVSNSLKELQNWGIVRVIHLPGDRRDHFECMEDVYEMFRKILEERKRREIDPTLRIIRECADDAGKEDSAEVSDYAKKKLDALHECFQLGVDTYDRMAKLPTKSALTAMRMGDKVLKTLGLTK